MKVDLKYKIDEVQKEKRRLEMLKIEAWLKSKMFEETMKAFIIHNKVDITTKGSQKKSGSEEWRVVDESSETSIEPTKPFIKRKKNHEESRLKQSSIAESDFYELPKSLDMNT